MKSSRPYLPLILLIVLTLSCGVFSNSSTSAPENVSPTTDVPQPASTNAPANTNTISAESVLISNGDSVPFNNPKTIDIDTQGNIYVTDMLNHRVVKFDPNGQSISQPGSFGEGDENFLPFGIAADGQGNIYVTDQAGERVRKFDSNGKLLIEWGSLGSGEGEFNDAGDIAIDGQSNVFVVDQQNHRIQKFDSDGKFLTTWGSLGEQDGQFKGVGHIAIDSKGNIYVSDDSILRISKFDNNGQFLSKWEHLTCQFSIEIKGLNGMWFDQQDHLFIGVFPPAICVLDDNGIFLGGWGEQGTQAGQFDFPNDVVGDNAGNIYVVEPSNNRVQKFIVK